MRCLASMPSTWTGSSAVRAGLVGRTAIARWTLARRHENGARLSVNVVAVGDLDQVGELRFAMEDQLAAGALIDALIRLGRDHVSPEVAVASASDTRGCTGPAFTCSLPAPAAACVPRRGRSRCAPRPASTRSMTSPR